MRWLALLLLLPLASAQVQVLSDDAGDATARLPGGADVPVDTGAFDLLALSVDESTELFTFHVDVASLQQENPTPEQTGRIVVDFNHADQAFRIVIYRDTLQGTAFYNAQLWIFDAGRGTYVPDQPLELDVDIDAGRFSVPVARDELLDGNGTAPTIGRSFDLFRAFSQDAGFTGVDINDAMPDSGFGEQPYDVVLGLQQKGHAHLSSDQPVRASNGEKGTFVFYVRASNLAADEDRFALRTDGVPEGWEVTLPAQTIRIEGNITRTFPVLVSVPFNHQHGAFESFVLQMDSQRDDSLGQIQLGIRYLAVPQPAGHHDTMFIHARDAAQQGTFNFDGDVAGYLNTLEEDERDTGATIPPEGGAFSCCGFWEWEMYLEPGLEIGLDFDTGEQGYLSVDLTSDVPLDGAVLRGGLWHLSGGETANDGTIRGAEQTLLASIIEGPGKTISGTTNFEANLQPTNASDLVPFDPEGALVLRLEVETDMPLPAPTEATTPGVVGGQLSLPLNEYRDRVEGVFNSLAGLGFRHESNPDRLVNAGDTVLFNLTLRNDGAVDDVFALRVNGTNVDWARILGDQKVLVTTGNERRIAVAVSPPEDATDGDIIDLIVTAQSEAEATVQGNIRIVATVDNTVDHPDEAGLIQDVEKSLTSKKKTPGLAAPLLIGALALFARRRQ